MAQTDEEAKKLAIQAAHKAQKAVDYIMKNQQMEEKAA